MLAVRSIMAADNGTIRDATMSRSSAKDEIAARRSTVAQLVIAHHSLRSIADDLGVNKSTIHRDIEALRIEWQKQRLAAMDQAAAEDLQRLSAIERTLWPFVQRGDLQALDRLLKVMERKAKLLGLDAPDRIEHLLKSEAEKVAAELGLDVTEVLASAEAILAGID